MSRLNRRTRVISIRLSDDEYTQMQNLCASKGVESFSELARAAMKMFIRYETAPGRSTQDNNISARVNEMDLRVSALDREVSRMSSMMGLGRVRDAQ